MAEVDRDERGGDAESLSAGPATGRGGGQQPQRSELWRTAYPDEMREREAALIERRRALLGHGTPAEPGSIGLALSGGGIRSATFSLGVLQALAKHRLLGRFDYLSTVSGGGYIGSFWGAWLSRHAPPRGEDSEDAPAADASTDGVSAFDRVQQALASFGSPELRWLRENGRYLSPNGAGDLFAGVAEHLRNWVSIHAVLGALLLGVFLLVNLLASAWLNGAAASATTRSPWFALSAFPLAAAVVLAGAYWTWPFSEAATYRNRITRGLTAALIAFGMLVVLALMDTVARILYLHLAEGDLWRQAANLAAVVSPIVVAVTAGAHKVLALLDTRAGESRLSIPMGIVAGLAAAVLALLWLTFWATNAQILSHRDGVPLAASELWPRAAGALVVAFVFGNIFAFVNRSSLATLYASRLSRAYLGASNPERQQGGNRLLTETLGEDDIPLAAYAPHEAGGPLHLINVTMNETVKAPARVEYRDSTGVPLAVGPAGMSVGIRHHAVWETVQPALGERWARSVAKKLRRAAAALLRRPNVQPDRATIRKQGLRAVNARPDGFHCLAEAFPAGARPAPIRAENLTLGQWISVSGAAFTTGLGTRTSAGLSFLLGFFNVRLGHWWLSAVDPAQRAAAAKRDLRGWAASQFNRFFPAQSLLLDEMMGRFRGPSRERWYLSDGGHFENTAAYELLRRRVRWIVICDNGCDPTYKFGDFAALVRKARIDFDAEIRPLGAEEIKNRLGSEAPAWAGSLSESVLEPGQRFASKYASVFGVYFEGSPTPESCIVLLKPTMTGEEPADLVNYAAENAPFPQQTTMDQYFDDAQWESYRRLGEWIGEAVFGSGWLGSVPGSVAGPVATAAPASSEVLAEPAA